MALIPWKNKKGQPATDDASPLVALRTEIDRLFDAFSRDPFGAIEGLWSRDRQCAYSPAVDVAEDETEVTIRAEMPGIDPKDIDLTVSGNQLILSGEKKETAEKQDKDAHQRECRFGSFRRVLPLPDSVDPDGVSAEYAHGVLTIKLKKIRAAAKRIEVKQS